jgi:hypothetical protein
MAPPKERNADTECREFQEKRTCNLLFALVKEIPVCLIWKESLAVMKEYKKNYITQQNIFNMEVFWANWEMMNWKTSKRWAEYITF